MKIIYGSSNKAKLQEVKTFFENNNIDVEIISLKDIGFNEEIDENGETFEENSLIKAKAIKDFCNRNNINETINNGSNPTTCKQFKEGRNDNKRKMITI